jgi:hypothetical protein
MGKSNYPRGINFNKNPASLNTTFLKIYALDIAGNESHIIHFGSVAQGICYNEGQSDRQYPLPKSIDLR